MGKSRKKTVEQEVVEVMDVDPDADAENGDAGEEEETTEAANNDFQVIGSLKQNKVKKVTPSIPKWMSNSTKFDGNLETNCSDLDQFADTIDSNLLENLKKNKIEKLFPVQKAVIPALLESFQKLKYCQPRDVCVLSPTGSGKTLAFAIPIVNHLLKRVVTQIRALVILPVSDLATQVHKVFQMLCKGNSLRVGLATSSQRKSQSDAMQFYRKRVDGVGYICQVDILVATPGKLIDLIQHGDGFTLKHLEILVIDEADRMMNETQFHWLREIEFAVFQSNSKLPCACLAPKTDNDNRTYHMDALTACSISPSNVRKKALHKILFSATLTTDPEKIDHLSLYYPELYNVSNPETEMNGSTVGDPKQTIPLNLKEYLIIADKDKKPLIVWHLVKVLMYRQILCFTDSVSSTHRLFQLMKQLPEIVVSEFSSKQNIKKRAKVLSQFENGAINMIISTDIFARGLDVNGINCVVCYDPPRNETAYIHRIGRTARAGNEGTAISLVTPEQLKHFTIVSRRAHKSVKKLEIEKLNIKESDLKPLIPMYTEALKTLESDVKSEGKSNYLRKRRQITKSKFSVGSTVRSSTVGEKRQKTSK